MDQQPERAQPTEDASEVVRRNIEQSKRLIEEQQHAQEHPNVIEPEEAMPGDADETRPPGQWNVPRGMTTGRGMGGGSANQRDQRQG